MRELATRNVPFFDYSRLFTRDEEAYLDIIRDVGRRGAFILQKDLEQFEQNLAAAVGARYALGVGNGTDGLMLALRAAGIGGGEVIFCSHTYVATAAAIHFVGAVPVPVEAAPDHSIDPKSVEAAITPRTRAILPTHLNGRTCDMDALRAIAEAHRLLIVEDAAQALGSKFKGQCAGTFGTAAATSFYPAKLLGSFGDAGAVFTNEDTVFDRLYQLRDHGRDRDGEVASWGRNSRLDNLQAAILDYKLKSYDRAVERRRALAAVYQERLGHLEPLRLPPAPNADPDHFDVFQNYEVEAERRDELRAFLKERGIGTAIQWGGKAVHQLVRLGFTQRLPYTEELFTRLLLLPMNTGLDDDDVEYVCEQIQAFYARH